MDNANKSGEAPVYYANGVQMALSIYDVRLDFTLATGPGADTSPVAIIHVSPQLAKVLERLLRVQVRAYEKQTGGLLALPNELTEPLGIKDMEE